MKAFKRNGVKSMPYMNRDNADYLVNKYADTILRISYMYLKQTQDAEDICQDVFMIFLAKDYQFAETYFFSNASFIKDGVRYLIFTNDDVSADDLFKMAAELINR